MRKKISIILCILLCLFLFAACGEKETPTETAPQVETILLNPEWQYADFSVISSGSAMLYHAKENRNGIIIGVNAGHGTEGGAKAFTYCHPDKSPKTTNGSTEKGAIQAPAVAVGMMLNNGESEASANLKVALKLKEKLLAAGFDVLMLRDGDDVQLDNVARTIICNNIADCHIAIHFGSDSRSYDKGCFYISVPDSLKSMEPVASNWQNCDALGQVLIYGLAEKGIAVYGDGNNAIDLTQTSYSTIPSVVIELGNQCTNLNEELIDRYAEGLLIGIRNFFNLRT
ncbi:MAG: N-acetylmuramoyl-L-alanine amidase [Lachnospiraceae bacterium]|nr:N-acetylmuramoyl-L-alanine amidase [Lachnospiraceae bacterium]